MPHDPYGQGDHWRDRDYGYRSNERWRGERADYRAERRDEDRHFSDDRDRHRYRPGEYMSRREAEDFSRRIGEGEWGWGAHGHDRDRDRRTDRHYGRDRGGNGLVEQAKEVVRTIFSPYEDGRMRNDNRGRGPRGYYRSDARIEEDVCERLTEDPYIDASDIEVRVQDREVTLAGTVGSRDDKRRAERIVEDCNGVTHVQNNLRVDDYRRDRHAYGAARGAGPAPTLGAAGADQEAAAFLSGARNRDNR